MLSRILPFIDIRKFLRVFAFLFVLNLGIVVAGTLLKALLLIHYGAKIIPLMTMGLGILELFAAFLSAAWAKSKRKTDLLSQILALLTILITLVYFSLFFDIVLLLPLAFVVMGGLMGVVYIQVDIITTHLFSADELDRVYPKLTIAYSLSSIVGGLILGTLIGFIGNQQAFLIPMFVLLLSVWMTFRLYKFYPTLLSSKTEALALQLKHAFFDPRVLERSKQKTGSHWDEQIKNFFDSIKSLRNNATLRTLVILTILSTVGGEFFAFGLNTSVTQNFSGDSLTQFLAYLDMVINVIALPFSLFFLTGTLKRLSFSQSYLFHSFLSLGGLAILSFFISKSTLAIPFIASLIYIFISLGVLVYETATNSLYRLVPEHERDNARSLTQGIGESVSIIISACIVAVAVNLLSVTTVLRFALIPAILYCLFASRLARVAYRSLEHMLKGKRESDVSDAVEILAERRGKILIEPLIALYPHASPDLKMKIIATLGEIHNKTAYEFLHKAVFSEPLELRKSLLRSLGKFKGNHSYLLMFLIQQKAPASVLRECLYALVPHKHDILRLVSKDLLLSVNPQIRTQAMVIMDDLKDSNPENLERVLAYTEPPNPPFVVGQALKTLYHRDPLRRSLVLKGIGRLLASPQKEEVIIGLNLVGDLSLKSFEFHLFQKIDNEPDQEVKSVALKALSALNPEVSVDYFSYYLTYLQADSAFYAEVFTRLDLDTRQMIINSIARNPVEAIDHAIRNLLPHIHKIKPELEILYAAISQKFKDNN